MDASACDKKSRSDTKSCLYKEIENIFLGKKYVYPTAGAVNKMIDTDYRITET